MIIRGNFRAEQTNNHFYSIIGFFRWYDAFESATGIMRGIMA